MWDTYDVIYHMCQFADQETETSILSTTKYINDMIGVMRYRFSSKEYETSLPICGKIIPFIDRICRDNSAVISFECLENASSIEECAYGSCTNFGVARKLCSAKFSDIRGIPPLPKSCIDIEITEAKLRVSDLPDHLVDVCLDEVHLCSYDLSHMKSLLTLHIDAVDSVSGMLIFPDNLEELFLDGDLSVIDTLPRSLKYLSSSVFVRSLPHGLVDLEINFAEEIPADYFPDTLKRIDILYGNLGTHFFIWPPGLEHLEINTGIAAGNAFHNLPRTIVEFSAYTDLNGILPNLRSATAKQITSGQYDSLRYVCLDSVPNQWFIEMFRRSRIVDLRIPIDSTTADMFAVIPSTLQRCHISSDESRADFMIGVLPNIRKLKILQIKFRDDTIFVPDMVEKLVVRECGIKYAVFHGEKLRSVRFWTNSLQSIDNLPDSVTYVDVSGNLIRKISKFPRFLTYLDVTDNPLTESVDSPSSLRRLVMHRIDKDVIRVPESCERSGGSSFSHSLID